MGNTSLPLRSGEPRRIGAYAVLGRLGEGGQGLVYLAESPGGQKVAVKVLRAGWTYDEEARRRLADELIAARQVTHACTAVVLDADMDAAVPYIVSEYVDGPSLQRIVERDGTYAGTSLERLAIYTATALTAIHGARVVHRDLKPANVLIGPDGPRVVDFGIARALESTSISVHTPIGTPPYMAPEQYGNGSLGPAADVWAWAATMVFAASGRPPFGQDAFAAVANRILNHPPDLSGLTGELRDLIHACLAKDPAVRPSAMAALGALLGHEDRVPPAGPPPAAQIYPFYLVCDESTSMSGAPVESLNRGLDELHREMVADVAVCEKARLSMIAFSTGARVLLPLSDLGSIGGLPSLDARGGTHFGAAFAVLREEIARDVAGLKAQGFTVYRPVVFFLSDGRPTDEGWRDAYDRLIAPEFAHRPHVVAFGMSDCDTSVIRLIATARAFIADGSLPVTAAIAEFVASVTQSMMGTVTGVSSLITPDQVSGFSPLPLDTM